MGRDSREVWAKRVERWRSSGLSAKGFAAGIGVNARTLVYWKWRLGKGRKPGQVRPKAADGIRFLEVTPNATPADTAESPRGDADEIEAALEVIARDGIRVRVPSHFGPSALRLVLTAMRGE